MGDASALPKGQPLPQLVRASTSTAFKLPKDSSAKRHIACSFCRKRKLKCDGQRPLCSSCVKFKQCDCHYELKVKKSGPKKGYVKQLEERLSMIEGMLSRTGNTSTTEDLVSKLVRDTDSCSDSSNGNEQDGENESQTGNTQSTYSQVPLKGLSTSYRSADSISQHASSANSSASLYDDITQSSGTTLSNSTAQTSSSDNVSATSSSSNDTFSELIELNIEEAMPQQDLIDILIDHYFSAVYRLQPFIHRNTFLSEMAQSFKLRPPVYLQYSILAISALSHDKYHEFADVFYRRAKKYLEKVEMYGSGECIVELRYVQACILLFEYEKRSAALSRAWISSSKASRAAILLNLHIIDSKDMDHLYSHLQYYRKEEMRRTFWAAFAGDRFMSIGNSWPMVFPEVGIDTNLPGSLISFEQNVFEKGCVFSLALKDQNYLFSHKFSSYSFCLLTTVIFGKIQQLAHKKCTKEEYKMDGSWWKSFLEIDSSLSSVILALPKLSQMSEHSPEYKSFVEVHIASQAAVVYLYQWSLSKMKQLEIINEKLLFEFHSRCLLGSNEILRLIREQNSNVDFLNSPCSNFSLYIAATAFISTLKTIPFHREIRLQLDFVITLMKVMSEKIPLANGTYSKIVVQLAELKEVIENFSQNDIKIFDIECTGEKFPDDFPLTSLIAKFYQNIPQNVFSCHSNSKNGFPKYENKLRPTESEDLKKPTESDKSSPLMFSSDTLTNFVKPMGTLRRGNLSETQHISDQSPLNDPSVPQISTTTQPNLTIPSFSSPATDNNDCVSLDKKEIRLPQQLFDDTTTTNHSGSSMALPACSISSREDISSSNTNSMFDNLNINTDMNFPNTNMQHNNNTLHAGSNSNHPQPIPPQPIHNQNESVNLSSGTDSNNINYFNMGQMSEIFTGSIDPGINQSLENTLDSNFMPQMYGSDLDPLLQNLTPRAFPPNATEWNWNSEMTLNRLMTDIMSEDFSITPL
ncbi:hypothetical protein NADFUDRAFT_40708 [Nadsonia fulvescens var. elongata DSM 6958]|uniref:Zn(2)-C6 fungal-type domain-containing protein n=1 Tax=Nadsonia fulvescens var. elongata DSM 6958 TaxID=857566 RepID=A0A1E3PRU8_9ASCO|nr:hypothetical protein NADFUDRAFT_40708 [Nadsonia fulvescens var. elongata DSM 6958]